MMVRQTPSPGDEGFTLVELLVAMALFGLVTTLLLGFALSTSDVSRRNQEMAEVDEGARLAMERMTRELREASTLTAGSGTSVTLRTAFDCDDVDPSERFPSRSEVLSYSLVGDELLVTLSENAYVAGAAPNPWSQVGPDEVGVLVDHVNAFTVDFRKDGATTTWANADAVLLALTVADERGNIARRFETRATLRNVGTRCWTLE